MQRSGSACGSPELPAPSRPDTPHVVALAGGGGQLVDAARYVRAVADAHLLARARFPALRTTLVTGPYGAAPDRIEGFTGLTVVRSPNNLDALLAGASLVVSQAGYNAIAEIRTLRKACVLVPGHRKSEDQLARAKRLVGEGSALLARPSARSFANRIEQALDGGLSALERAHTALVPRNREAAAEIRSVLVRGSAVKRIVLVAHDFAPKLGGMESVARGLAASLVAAGIAWRASPGHHGRMARYF